MSLLALALSCLVYGVASYLQGIGVSRATTDSTALGRTLRAMLSAPFLAGVVLDLAGVGLSAVALRELPLFLVQAAGVASVGVTAVLAAVTGDDIDRRHLWRGIAAGTAGCALLTVAADPAPAAPLPVVSQLAIGFGIPVAAVLAAVAARRTPRAAGILLTTLAGLAFAGVGLCLRSGGTPGAESLGIALAVLLGLTGTALFAVALQRCPVTVASGVLAFTELVVPAAVGLLVLGDRVRPGFEGAMVVGGLLVAVALAEVTRAESGAGRSAGPDPYDAPDGLVARTVLPSWN